MGQEEKTNSRLKLLLIYDYFDPAYLAGGPIASCVNLVATLENDLTIDILTSNTDLDGSVLQVKPDQWLRYGSSNVLYGDKLWSWWGLYRILRERKPDVVYLNGVYSLVSVIYPLLMLAMRLFHPTVVISPRGMLLPHSLALKPTKKKLYLSLFRRLVSWVNVVWHVTSRDEKLELQQVIPSASDENIVMIGNVPRTDLAPGSRPVKSEIPGFVTIALISPMKNILKVIQALKDVRTPVEYTIYGPVKDPAYWNECLKAIEGLPAHINVRHHGPVSRAEIQGTLEQHDFYVQPSRSENFGHSIFESLMVGLPVITSNTTPWAMIEKEGAGLIVHPERDDELRSAVLRAIELTQEDYEASCSNARRVAESYLREENFKQKYLELFTGTANESHRYKEVKQK